MAVTIRCKLPYTLYNGDCCDVLKNIDSNSISSIITDPPYDLVNDAGGFLGAKWDSTGIAFNSNMWGDCLRVLKPGGYLLAFSSPRTYHRMACAIEDANFEIRDQLMWLFATGLSKSLNIAKAIDETSGVDLAGMRLWIKFRRKELGLSSNEISVHFSKTGKISGTVRCWENGYGTPTPEQFNKLCDILKSPEKKIPEAKLKIIGYKKHTASANYFTPNADHSVRVQVPILEYQHPLAKEWSGWGSNVSPAHEPICMARKPLDGNTITSNVIKHGVGGLNIEGCKLESGKLPSNVLLTDVDDELLEDFSYFGVNNPIKFFYNAKASQKERNLYVPEGMDNNHPCLKPLELMRYLTRLVTPKGGTVLDPFMGSGTCGLAAREQGFRYVGIELMKEYFDVAEARLKNQQNVINISI